MRYFITQEQLKELAEAENGVQIFVLCTKIAREQKLDTTRTESMNKGLAQTLVDFEEYAQGRAVKLQSVPLTKNQFTNFQKLAYHSLVSNPQSGIWKTTDCGHSFIAGEPVNKSVTIDHGNVIEKSLEKTTIHKLLGSQPAHHFAQRQNYLD